METVEKTILRNLVSDGDYARRVLPFLKKEYFSDITEKIVFEMILNHVEKYNSLPTKSSLEITIESEKNINDDLYKKTVILIVDVTTAGEKQDETWLLDTTEKFCKDRAIFNAIMESIEIIDGKSKQKTANALPEILSDALAVSFDEHIGHDYCADGDDRYNFYHMVEKRISFDLDFFNRITNGGVPNKTLNVILAGTGVGKSMFMCHMASGCYSAGKNVLYITCEMAEERIAERIDANLMDITMDDLKVLPKATYETKLKRVTDNIQSRLIIKEYPTATANAQHFRILLQELKLKKNFTPDIIFIDYLNICTSSRFRANSDANSYTLVKAIAEELRGIAVEYNLPVFTATQTNRSGFSNSDVGLENTSESFGLPATADFMFALISTDELEEQGQIMVKQLKNRYNDIVANKKFVIGVNRGKMKLYDVNNTNAIMAESNQDGKDDASLKPNYDPRGFADKFGPVADKIRGLKV